MTKFKFCATICALYEIEIRPKQTAPPSLIHLHLDGMVRLPPLPRSKPALIPPQITLDEYRRFGMTRDGDAAAVGRSLPTNKKPAAPSATPSMAPPIKPGPTFSPLEINLAAAI